MVGLLPLTHMNIDTSSWFNLKDFRLAQRKSVDVDCQVAAIVNSFNFPKGEKDECQVKEKHFSNLCCKSYFSVVSQLMCVHTHIEETQKQTYLK